MHVISKGILAGMMTLLLAAPSVVAQEKVAEEKKDDAKTEEVTTTAEAEEADDEEGEGKDWSVGVRVGTSIGQGTFVNVANDNPYYDPNCTDPVQQGCVGDASNAFDRASLSFGVNAGYTVGDFSFGGSVGASKSLTAGGSTLRPRDMRFGDVGLSAGWAGYTFESIGLTIAPGIDFQLPTSLTSQFATLILGTSLGVGISKTFFEKLSLSIGVGVGKDFHRFKSPVYDTEKFSEEDAYEFADNASPESIVYRDEQNLGSGLIAVDGVNTEWGLSTSFSASIPVWQKLRLSASYGLSTSWTYNVTGEENEEFGDLTPDVPGINEGRGVGQGFSTSVGLSYPIQLGDLNLGLSGGIGTGGFPKTSDNKSFRFPFWNTTGAASNGSALRFGISANY